MYLLDTNTVTLYLRRTHTRLTERVLSVPPETVYISVVTAEEILRGRLDYVRKQEPPKDSTSLSTAYNFLAEPLADLCTFQVQTFDGAALTIYRAYAASVLRVGRQDCKIAATAASRGWTVITSKTADFARIGTIHEDWTV